MEIARPTPLVPDRACADRRAPHIADRCTAHKQKGVSAVYNRNSYARENGRRVGTLVWAC
jgi:hypothetical protein